MGIMIRWDENDLIVYNKEELKSIDIEVNPITITCKGFYKVIIICGPAVRAVNLWGIGELQILF